MLLLLQVEVQLEVRLEVFHQAFLRVLLFHSLLEVQALVRIILIPGGFRPGNADDIFKSFFTQFGGSGGEDEMDFFQSSRQGGFPGQGGGIPSSFFGGMSGGMPGGMHGMPQSRQRPSSNNQRTISKKLPCSLEDLYTGTTKRLKVTRKVIDHASSQFVQNEKVLEVLVKAGWKAGTKIKFAGEGDELGDGTSQDLEFIIEEKGHSVFTRHGDDLKMKLEIDLVDALCGFVKAVHGIDGRAYEIKGAQGGSTVKPDQEIVVRKAGMPNKMSDRGDLIVQIKIKFPSQVNEGSKAQLRRMLAPGL